MANELGGTTYADIASTAGDHPLFGVAAPVVPGHGMKLQTDFAAFRAAFSRRERYRLAGKFFRFNIYRSMEAYVGISLMAFLLLPWLAQPVAHWLLSGNMLVVMLIAFAHSGQMVVAKPRLCLASALEALGLWVCYKWLLSPFFAIPNFWALCAFLFVLRFWYREERALAFRAFLRFRETENTRRLLSPDPSGNG